MFHEYSVFINVICLNNYMDTLRMPQLDINHLPVNCERYTLLILKLYRSM